MTTKKGWIIDETTFPTKGTIEEKIKFLIRYGVLAANNHNAQAWKFKIRKNILEIYPDKKRRLPSTDPKDRELWISLGCALENVIIAARRFGLHPTPKTLNDKIIVSFKKSKQKKTILFDYITTRVTNRRKAKRMKVAPKIIEGLKKLSFNPHVNAYLFTDKEDFEAITNLVKQANEIQLQSKKYKKELFKWMRFNPSSVKKHNDGITYKAIDIPPINRPVGETLLSIFMRPKYMNDDAERNIKNSSGIIIITSKKDCQTCLTNTGRTLQKILLNLTSKGLSYSFLNSPCQVSRIRKKMIKEIKENPQVILRIGYAKTISHAPRRPIEEVIIE